MTVPVMKLMKIARIKNYARDLGIKSIIEKPMFVEFCFGETPNINPENMISLKNYFGFLLKILPQQNLLQIKITPVNKQALINLCLKAMKILSGEKRR